jgi:acyl dehydratase
MTLYYEDLPVGYEQTVGTHRMNKAEMLSFAGKWDPQDFHVDPEAAEDTVHEGIIASGLHTIGAATRLMVDNFLDEAANQGGLGIDNLRFHRAVEPGDRLTVSHEVVGRRVSDSDPDRGIVEREIRVTDADGEPVATWETAILMERQG